MLIPAVGTLVQDQAMCTEIYSRECPQCGGEMLFRLSEFECTGCGHFMQDEPPSDDHQLSAAATQIRRAVRETPFAAPGASSGLAKHDDSQRQALCGNWLRILFLTMAFTEFVAMGLLVQHFNPDATITSEFIRSLVVGGVLLTGFAALTLFVDWRAFKIFVLVLTLLAIGVYLVEFTHVWSGEHQLPVVRLMADLIVLGWFAILNFKDIIRKA